MPGRRRHEHRGGRDERGVALVEFALLLPFIAMIVMGSIDVGRAYSLQNRLKNASREGAVYAQVKPDRVSCGTDASVTQRARDEDADLPSVTGFAIRVLRADGSQVTGCGSGGVVTGEKLRVQALATFDVLTPFVGAVTGDPIDLTATTEVIVQ